MELVKHFIPFCIKLKNFFTFSIFIRNNFFTFVKISLSLTKR